jgi:hypothetical protein
MADYSCLDFTSQTRRTLLAAAVIQGLLADGNIVKGNSKDTNEQIAKKLAVAAVRIADFVCAELDKE